MANLSFFSRIKLLLEAGFPPSTIGTMLAISEAECGGGNTQCVNSGGDTGWLQVNIMHIGEPGFPAQNQNQLFDPVMNAKAAYWVWRQQGFNAWCTYPGGCGGQGNNAAGQTYAITDQYIHTYNQQNGTNLGSYVGGKGDAPSTSPTGPSSGGGGGSIPVIGGIEGGVGAVAGGIEGAAGSVIGLPGTLVGDAASGIGGALVATFGKILPFIILSAGILIVAMVLLREIASKAGAGGGSISGSGASAPPIPVE